MSATIRSIGLRVLVEFMEFYWTAVLIVGSVLILTGLGLELGWRASIGVGLFCGFFGSWREKADG